MSTSPEFYQLVVSIWARPPAASCDAEFTLNGVSCRPLRIPSGAQGTPFSVSFETAYDALSQLDRMLIEPDGSFVWKGSDREWQLDGNLYDRSEKLLYVDLAGTVPPTEFDRLLTACGWPETQLMFEIRAAGIYLDESELRAWASR